MGSPPNLRPPSLYVPSFLQAAAVVFAAANLTSFLAYWLDKSRARRDKPRISESRLLQLTFLGPVGAIPGVWWVRHKSSKLSYLVKYFAVLVVSLAAHAAVAYWWLAG